jgi:hypothetical protein
MSGCVSAARNIILLHPRVGPNQCPVVQSLGVQGFVHIPSAGLCCCVEDKGWQAGELVGVVDLWLVCSLSSL